MKINSRIALQDVPAIISSCVINNFVVIKDEKIVYESKQTEITAFLYNVYQTLGINYPKFYKMDNLSKLGFLSVEFLLLNRKMNDDYLPEDIGVILSNANSSLDADIKYFKSIIEIPSPALFVYTLPNIMIGEICIRNNFKGENTFLISPEFNPDFMLSYINNLFKLNYMKACIFGWVDCFENEYKSVVYLVEKKSEGELLPFEKETLTKIYQP